MGFGIKGLFGAKDAAKAREAVREHARHNEPVSAKELAAADPNVVLDPNGKVKLPETIANMRRDDFGAQAPTAPKDPVARDNYFNFRYFAEKQGPEGFVGVPAGVDVRNAARLRSLEDAAPGEPTRLEALPWKDFVGDLKGRNRNQLESALAELEAVSAHLESLTQDLPHGDPTAKQLGKRQDELVSRTQLILQALENPKVLDHAI